MNLKQEVKSEQTEIELSKPIIQDENAAPVKEQVGLRM